MLFDALAILLSASARWACAEPLSFCCAPLYLLAGVSTAMERERQQNDRLADG